MNTPADTGKAVVCPSCGGSITLRALGHSVMASCPSCAAQIDVSQPEIRLIRKYQQAVDRLQLPLGTRGTLRGQVYEVVGALQRVDAGYHWQEYLLFNPYVGFRWLVCAAGHWNFGETVKDAAGISVGVKARYRGEYYKEFQSGLNKVEWVVGEFYWRVGAGNTANTIDYVAPPLMLSLEKAKGEFTWTLLEYIEPEEITTAFKRAVGNRTGIAPNQPNRSMRALRAIMPILLTALGALLLVQIITAVSARNNEISLGTYSFAQGHAEQQVFGPFTLDAPLSLNELRANVYLNNSWVELDCSLVNTATGETIDFTNAHSLYSGFDADGSWSEEDGDARSLITSVPAGEYNLVVEGAAGGDSPISTRDTRLQLVHDVAPWRNFWLAAGMILLYPLWLSWRSYRFERDRWYESDFDPYTRLNDED
jgi:hypothetical protein